MADQTAQTHEQWLEEMDRKAREKQQSFIANIAGRLGRETAKPPAGHPYKGAPSFWQGFEWPMEERIERFSANFRSAGGHVVRVPDLAAASAFIAEKAKEMSAHYIVRQQEDALEALGLEEALPGCDVSVWNDDPGKPWKALAAQADFGVVLADHAAAYTGSLAVLSDKDKGRSVSLLPTVLMALLPVDRLVTRLGEILMPLDADGREKLPAGVHFISGPSRSADIENDLTIGVHGPGVVYVIVIG
ncbi:LutC/YkgG family protein [Paenibacillus methanolicus]|uniref:L-lactate dehydrogenase complex protein LldG n=1 Tax=Paenibacillus methanolicus TaxID=582686 RepID=A0A5S5C2W1_9BACL|nr:lactate utilization protein [Paenibacillus methanolicus]TYP73761.1 L-lactate dehydrogenase complex protein LldG [Paenibacillus methanolicus]